MAGCIRARKSAGPSNAKFFLWFFLLRRKRREREMLLSVVAALLRILCLPVAATAKQEKKRKPWATDEKETVFAKPEHVIFSIKKHVSVCLLRLRNARLPLPSTKRIQFQFFF